MPSSLFKQILCLFYYDVVRGPSLISYTTIVHYSLNLKAFNFMLWHFLNNYNFQNRIRNGKVTCLNALLYHCTGSDDCIQVSRSTESAVMLNQVTLLST